MYDLLAEATLTKLEPAVSQWLIEIVAVVAGGVLIAMVVTVGKHVGDANKHVRGGNNYVTTTQYAQCRSDLTADISRLQDSVETIHGRVDDIYKVQLESTQKVLTAIGRLKD